MMKKLVICAVLLLSVMVWGCKKSSPPNEKGEGKLSIALNLDEHVAHMTRSGLPDLADFIVEIWDDTQLVEEFNPVGSANAEISLAQGDYTVKAYSASFSEAAFETPVYGAEQSISIISGQDASANITCTQTNAGVRIVYDTEFQAAYASYSTSIAQGARSLDYSGEYAGSTGHFLPGDVVVSVTADGRSWTMDLTLFPRRIYTVTVKEMPLPGGNFGLTFGMNTDVDQEGVDFLFPREDHGGGEDPDPLPSGTVYSEDFGTYYMGSDFSLNEYTGWGTTGMSWSGQAVVTRPGTVSSGYSFASGDNAVKFAGSNKELQVENTALSSFSTPLTLTFALSGHDGGPVQPSDLELYVDRGSGIPIGMDYTLTDGGAGWLAAEMQGKLQPPFSYLILKFISKREGIYLDDIRITEAE